MNVNVLAFLDYTPIPNLHLGPLSVSPHGIATGVGFLAGARLMLPAAKARGIDEDHLWRLLIRAIIAALIGARFTYVLNHLGDYTDRPLEALRVWQGGASLLGGIVFAVLAAIPEMRRQRLDFWTVMDAAAPGLALGIAIGRAVHQPALYDLVSVLALLGLLLWLRRRRLSTGSLFLTFVAWYGIGRLAEDFFRVDETHGLFLTSSQWAATVAALTAVVLLITGRRPGTRVHEPGPLDAPPERPAVAPGSIDGSTR